MLSRFLLVTLISSLSLLQACTNDHECSLNGVCTNNLCTCDPWWIGSDCNILNLLPADKKANGYNRNSENISSWCGTIMPDPTQNDTYYMFVSEFVNNCPLDNWVPNSRVIRTISKGSLFGPYTFQEEVLPPFHHNPYIIQHSDGTYLLYTIGSNYSKPLDCSSGQTYPGWDGWPLESGVSLWSASSPLGPWTSQGVVLGNDTQGTWDQDTTNPAPYPLPNGTVLLMYRGCKEGCNSVEQIGLARATTTDWKGPYTRTFSQPLFPNPNEDPFLWVDQRGNYHALFHSLEVGGGFGGPNIGRHAWSSDGLTWTYGNQTLTYNVTVKYTDGTSIDFHRRERPSLYFKPGKEKQPLLLITGVQEKGTSQSYTFIQPIGP